MEDDDPAGIGVHPAISAARAAPRNSQGAVLRVLESVPPCFAAPDPTGDRVGQPPAATDDTVTMPPEGTPGTSFETPRKCPRCGEGIWSSSRPSADTPERHHDPHQFPTHWLIRRPTPMRLIVRTQPQRYPTGAPSSTVRGPLGTCKQAPFLPARLARRRLLALTH